MARVATPLSVDDLEARLRPARFDGGAALLGDLAFGVGSHDCGRSGGDELCAALDRAGARPLQRERS